jgi:hypothetical protein
MDANLSFNAFQKKIEPHKCRLICIVNGIGDSCQQMRLHRLKQNLHFCDGDFEANIHEARDSVLLNVTLCWLKIYVITTRLNGNS